MSAAAAAVKPPAGQLRVVTRGYAKIPNSLIENQAILTHAELSLALVLLRKADNGETIPVSDDNWTRWTGLQARQKYNAIKGLTAKKALSIKGRGLMAKYGFDHQGWRGWVSCMPRQSERARTVGRAKGDPVKAGSMVHPDCASGGCSRLAEQNGGLSLVPSCDLQQVAKFPPVFPIVSTQSSKQVRGSNLQPVANSAGWPAATKAVISLYPMAGAAFMARLVDSTRSVFRDVTDPELAAAIQAAYVVAHRRQTSEGLFIFTVPEAIAALRRVPAVGVSAGVVNSLAVMVERVSEVVRGKGPKWSKHLTQLDKLKALGTDDAAGLEETMERIERELAATAKLHLTGDQIQAAETAVVAGLEGYRTRFTSAQLETLRGNLWHREILAAAGIPRLGSLYV